MTYRAGTYGLGRIGIPDDVPRVICDVCGSVLRIRADRRPPAWLLDGKAPPKWRMVRTGDERRDVCPKCRAAEVGS